MRYAARLDELPEDGLHVVTLDGERICLARVGDEVYAMSDVCTHQEFAMSDGLLLPGARIECAWHGAVFDCRTGAVCRAPATEPLPVYAVEVRDGVVWVGERLP
ncbi:MAG TPA: non-heme iron oxygenase ferredoxin subunit [Gemmatimonadaceae bacterium]